MSPSTLGRTATTFIGGSPMKVPVKRFAGRSRSVAGVAYCCSTPASITAMRSASAFASVWSWVTRIAVWPRSFR